MKNIELISSTSPSVIVENAPLNFVRNGEYHLSDGQLYFNGTAGNYWTTTTGGSNYTRSFYWRSYYFGPQHNATDTYKGNGYSVRCVGTKISFFQITHNKTKI